MARPDEPNHPRGASATGPVEPPGLRALDGREIRVPRFSPTPFGEYMLEERIGSGGMAEIFLATSRGIEGFEKRLVIKRILPTLSDNEQFVRMFIEEARLCVALKHRNIVRVYDLGEIDHQYFIAMEYVDGRDLLKTLAACGRKKVGFPTDLALFIVMEILTGLDHAHGLTGSGGKPLGIIHRDVSPSNVLMSFEGQVKLGDFGIAKASTREKTATGILKGKFGYMAPEQVTGARIDHRADVFAAGIILYELLTGHRLFAGNNDLAVLERVRDARVDPPPRHYRPDLDLDLEQIVLRSLTRNPGDRFQTARAFRDAIASYVDRVGARVGPTQLARFMQRLFLDDPDEQERRSRSRLPSELDASHEERTSVSLPVEEEPETHTVTPPVVEVPDEVTMVGAQPADESPTPSVGTSIPVETTRADEPMPPMADEDEGESTLAFDAEGRATLLDGAESGPVDIPTAPVPESELEELRASFMPSLVSSGDDEEDRTLTFKEPSEPNLVAPVLTRNSSRPDPADRSQSWASQLPRAQSSARLEEPVRPGLPPGPTIDERTEQGAVDPADDDRTWAGPAPDLDGATATGANPAPDLDGATAIGTAPESPADQTLIGAEPRFLPRPVIDDCRTETSNEPPRTSVPISSRTEDEGPEPEPTAALQPDPHEVLTVRRPEPETGRHFEEPARPGPAVDPDEEDDEDHTVAGMLPPEVEEVVPSRLDTPAPHAPGREATSFGELVGSSADPTGPVASPLASGGDDGLLTRPGSLDDEGASNLFGVLSVLDEEEPSVAASWNLEVSMETESRDPEDDDEEPSAASEHTRMGALTVDAPAYRDPASDPRVGKAREDSWSRPPSVAPLNELSLDPPRQPSLSDPAELGFDDQTWGPGSSDPELVVSPVDASDPELEFTYDPQPQDDSQALTHDGDTADVFGAAPQGRLVSGTFELESPLGGPTEPPPPSSPTSDAGPRRQEDVLRRAVERVRPAKEMNRGTHFDTRTGRIDLQRAAGGPVSSARVPTTPVAPAGGPPPPRRFGVPVLWILSGVLAVAALTAAVAFAVGALAPRAPIPAVKNEPAPAEVPSAPPETPPEAAPEPSGIAETPPPPPEEAPEAPAQAQLEAAEPEPEPAPPPRRKKRRKRRKPAPVAADGSGFTLRCSQPLEVHVRGHGRFPVQAERDVRHALPPGDHVVTLVRDGRILDRRAVRLLPGTTAELPCP